MTNSTQSHRNHALKQLWEEEREMPKSEEILTAAEVDAASNILPSAKATIRRLIRELEHATRCMARSCRRCNQNIPELIARYKGEA